MEDLKQIRRIRYVALLFILLILEYTLLSVFFYFNSIKGGGEGVSVAFLGGGDDGDVYWGQIKLLFDNPNAKLSYTSVYVPIMSFIVNTLHYLSPMVVRFVNLLVFVVFVVGCLTLLKIILGTQEKELGSKRDWMPYAYLLIFFMVYPSLVYYATFSIYRDIWIYALFIWSIIAFVRFLAHHSAFHFVLYLLLVYGLYNFRAYAAATLILALGIYLLIHRMAAKKRKWVLIGLAVLFVAWYSFFKEVQLPIVNMSLSGALEYREGEAAQRFLTGGSDVNIKLNQPNVLFFLGAYLYSVLFNVFGPLIWQFKSVQMILTGVVEGIPALCAAIYVWRNRKVLTPSRQLLFTTITAVAWTFVIGLSNKNIGTAARLRVPTLVILAIVTIVIYAKQRRQKQMIKASEVK